MLRFGYEVFTPGLDRTRPIYSQYVKWVENDKIPVVTIAGTNGKGETAYSLEWLLSSEGYNSALWTSPHIESITERFSFNTKFIDINDLIKECEITFIEIDKENVKISFYEFLFLIFLKQAYVYYQNLIEEQKKKFILILEVGLGGRLDAVNHFAANFVCLTSISRDHCEILGKNYREILAEKCGVLRDEAVLISSLELAYLREEVENILLKYRCVKYVDLFQQGFLARRDDFSYRNQLLAYRCLELLLNRVYNTKPVKSLTAYQVSWPVFKGRSEILYKNNKKFIFIGAHNVDGVRKLINRYQIKSDHSFLILTSFSKREPKEVEQMIAMLCNLKVEIVVTAFEHPKAFNNLMLEKIALSFHQVAFKKSWKEFLKEVNEQKTNNEIIITGSYYFIGEVQRYIKNSLS